MDEQKNMFLAIVMSVAVMVAWWLLVVQPAEQTQRAQRLQKAQEVQTQQGTQPQPVTPVVKAPVPARDLRTVLKEEESKRVAILTPSLRGSISLKGGRVDYLELRGIRQTVKPDSPDVVLLSPAGTASPYYVQYGWQTDAKDVRLPDADTVWQTADAKLAPQSPVTLTWDNGGGLMFRMKFEVDENYLFTVTQSVENKSDLAVALKPQAVIVREQKPKVEHIYQFEGLAGFVGAQKKQEVTYEKAVETAEKREPPKTFANETGGWIGIMDRYWATALIPDQKTPYTAEMGRGASAQAPFAAGYSLAAVDLHKGGSRDVKSYIFAGAMKNELIEKYQSTLGVTGFDYLIDWGFLSFSYLPQLMFTLIDKLSKLTGHIGVAILAITVLIKLIFFPLNNRSFASMSKMKALQPEMVKIKERYPEDKQRQQQEMMALYKREKVNPLSGCLPILLQIPVFIALYNVLNVTFEMRHAPFFGWIHDLSAPDPTWIFNLFGLLPFDAPSWVPAFFLIGAWPVLFGMTMFLQMRLSPMPPDPIQQQVFTWMPLFFTAMMATAPAGLMIYWTWNNLLSMIQQAVIMSRHGTKIELFDNLGITKLIGRDASARPPKPINDNRPGPKSKPRRKGA